MLKIQKNNLPNEGEFRYYDYPDLKIEILIWNYYGEIKIYSSFCPHFGGQLLIKENQLYCPIHGYIFDPNSGKCVNREFGSKCKKIDFFEDLDEINIEIE